MKFSRYEEACLISCPDCYENKHTHQLEWRTMVCKEPHLLLNAKLRSGSFWAAERGFRTWPAKLVALLDKTIRVIFFGYNEFVDISPKHCRLYSTTTNILSKPKLELKDIENALEVIAIEFRITQFHFKKKRIHLSRHSLGIGIVRQLFEGKVWSRHNRFAFHFV